MNRIFDFSGFPQLETSRLRLLEMTNEDVTALIRHFGNEEVVRFLEMNPIQTQDQASEWLQWMGGFFSARDGLRWGAKHKSDGSFVGSVGLHKWNRESNYAELGYDLGREYWEQGYATEITTAVIDFGWESMNLNRIEADVVQGNTHSMAVLEKLGFQQEGVLRQRLRKGGKYYDIHRFGLLRKDYAFADGG
jgi:[ribosomal protein S5]-alanine N-acetyltransferase